MSTFVKVLGYACLLLPLPILVPSELSASRHAAQQNEIKSAMVETVNVEPGNMGRLVYVSGAVKSNTGSSSFTIVDPDTGISCQQCLVLQRVVKMYQWSERRRPGGSNLRFDYVNKWSQERISSEKFNDRSGRYTNKRFPMMSSTFTVPSAQVRGYTIPGTDLKEFLKHRFHLRVLPEDLQKSTLNHKRSRGSTKTLTGSQTRTKSSGASQFLTYKLRHGELMTSLKVPRPGDVRITYKYVPSDEGISVIGKQAQDGTLTRFDTPSGEHVHLIATGTHTATSLLHRQFLEHRLRTWASRIAAFGLSFLGFALITQWGHTVAMCLAISMCLGVCSVCWLSNSFALLGIGGVMFSLTIVGVTFRVLIRGGAK